MDAQRVAALITLGRYEFSDHAERERINDGFTVDDVKGIALQGDLQRITQKTHEGIAV